MNYHSKITCVLPGNITGQDEFVRELRNTGLSVSVFYYGTGTGFEESEELISAGIRSGEDLRKIAEKLDAEYLLMVLDQVSIRPGAFSFERLISVANSTGCGMIYSDYFDETDGHIVPHPLNDCQEGSLRDEFNFGPMVLFNTEAFKKAASEAGDYLYAGFYSLRLALGRNYEILHLPEFLYSAEKTDLRASGKKIFDYVDPGNRGVQLEMEKAVTFHLKEVGAFINHMDLVEADLSGNDFPVEASVIIPVRNREKTIGDAIESVMKQETDFPFNLIIVDNHSTDNTTTIIKDYAGKYDGLVHIIPERKDLGIGGCWNLGVHNENCGKFAVQLDSDDLYSDENTLSEIISVFYREKSVMVIGTYRMTNFNLEEIPPGIIDHSEWTPENGMNNALRINGLGAPRAFFTPVLRSIMVPNTSYGEDYSVGLAITGKYKIGRIYKPVYLCRRWEDNSDASLDTIAMNRHDYYKDRIRTIELHTRIRLNMKKHE